ncbi:MAG TPA: YceI family protein [Pyrinomonadaceae bacterium]|nr:YceI family protein [Pyrinomonadaceae bacterium]
MKRKHLAVALSALLLSFLPALGAALKFEETDKSHSNVGFSIPILGGLSHVSGKFTDFTVSIVHDDADVTKSSVNAVIKTASVDTGIERRDAHLRNPDFFDAEKFPEITFRSTRVEKKGDQYVAHGSFTMHGVTKEIALPFRINGLRKDEKSGRTTLGITARTTIKKSDFGMTWARPDNPNFLGDEVEIVLDILTRTAAPAPPAAAPASGR